MPVCTLLVAAWLSLGSPAHGQGGADGAGCPPPAAPEPAVAGRPLAVAFYGVSTLLFDDGRDQLLIDGYFSRPGPLRTLVLPIGPTRMVDRRLREAGVTRLRAVLTAHAHHDHALDTARIAELRPEAVVVGDDAVVALAVSRGVPASRTCVPEPGRGYAFGPYRITAYPTPHGPSGPILHWLLNHPLKHAFSGKARFEAYKDDENLSFLVEHGGRRILVHPSAGIRTYEGVTADVVFLGIGRLGKSRDDYAVRYWQSTVVDTQARLVVPVHWDSFVWPLKAKLSPTPRPFDDVAKGLRKVRDLAGTTVEVRMLDGFGTIELPAAPEGPKSSRLGDPSLPGLASPD